MFILRRNKLTSYEYIVAGLGNPGRQYEFTRHNAGFLFAEALADKYDFKINKLKFSAVCADAVIRGHRCLVIKPQTYMNNSGEAVRQAADFYKLPPEKIIVVFDDISLPVGKLRVRRNGSDGGHKGMKSIIDHLGTGDIARIKIGIGGKPNPEYDLADWVTSRFTNDELRQLRTVVDRAIQGLECILDGKTDEAMNICN